MPWQRSVVYFVPCSLEIFFQEFSSLRRNISTYEILHPRHFVGHKSQNPKSLLDPPTCEWNEECIFFAVKIVFVRINPKVWKEKKFHHALRSRTDKNTIFQGVENPFGSLSEKSGYGTRPRRFVTFLGSRVVIWKCFLLAILQYEIISLYGAVAQLDIRMKMGSPLSVYTGHVKGKLANNRFHSMVLIPFWAGSPQSWHDAHIHIYVQTYSTQFTISQLEMWPITTRLILSGPWLTQSRVWTFERG